MTVDPFTGKAKPGLYPHGACNFTPGGSQKELVGCAAVCAAACMIGKAIC